MCVHAFRTGDDMKLTFDYFSYLQADGMMIPAQMYRIIFAP